LGCVIITDFILLKKKKMMDKVVILYGSYAKGKQKEYSDIDTAIVSQHLRSWIFLSVRRF